MALVPGLREGVAVVPFVFLAVLKELLPRRVAGVDERDGVFDRVGRLAVADLVDAVGGVVVLQPVDEARSAPAPPASSSRESPLSHKLRVGLPPPTQQAESSGDRRLATPDALRLGEAEPWMDDGELCANIGVRALGD